MIGGGTGVCSGGEEEPITGAWHGDRWQEEPITGAWPGDRCSATDRQDFFMAENIK